jgi:hypothetical protein
MKISGSNLKDYGSEIRVEKTKYPSQNTPNLRLKFSWWVLEPRNYLNYPQGSKPANFGPPYSPGFAEKK